MSKSDLVGISSSFLCLLHCLALPILISMGYIFNFSLPEHWHGVDYIFITLGLIAAWTAARKTSSRTLKLGFGLTILIFSFSVLLHEQWYWMIYLSVSASLILIILHSIRWRYQHQCRV